LDNLCCIRRKVGCENSTFCISESWAVVCLTVGQGAISQLFFLQNICGGEKIYTFIYLYKKWLNGINKKI